MKDGFIKVAAASPVIKVADCDYNAERVIECIREADEKGVKLLVFPELTLTGASCWDLFRHRVILNGAEKALIRVVEASVGADMLIFVGLPLAVGPRVYSVAAAIWDGELIALVPRRTPNCFFEGSSDGNCHEIELESFGTVPLCSDALFSCEALPELNVAVDLGNDIQSIWTDTTRHARAGAQIVCQMAAFPATVSSTGDAELLAKAVSRHLSAGLVLAAPGKGESSTDRVYTGLCLVAEAGKLLAQDEQDGPARTSLALSEIDVQLLTNLRRDSGEFDMVDEDYTSFAWGEDPVDTSLTRHYNKHPHLPEDPKDLPAYCERMLDLQVSGLVKRMEYAGLTHCVVGISGGVDSTLAVMVSAMAVKRMGLPATNVIACTMPCFGTSSRTKSNAIVVAEQWGCEVRVIDIGKAVYQHFDDIGHAHDDYSVAFENAQARERTQVLMDIANKVNGLDVGTEDLSEFIDGWCTYNGDHTSMYDVNLGLTKTQVRANVSYIAQTTEDKVLKAALYDVLDCPVTPELLPIHDDLIEQKSEDAVGSYSLQDFFTFHILQDGFAPSKVFRLAKAAYGDEFTDEELKRWLTSWCRRLFSQQFKRSCLMDGPAVMAFTVSPRSGWLIPSDAEAALFLKDLENI
jgi:NAD+ synthase (glutamine-hydrolysing)